MDSEIRQKIADELCSLGVVTHNNLSDSQSGCVKIKTLEDLMEAIEIALGVVEREDNNEVPAS